MKKCSLLLLFAAWQSFAFGQTKIEKSVSVKPKQKVYMTFRFPNLVKVRTWDKNEIKIMASVSINRGQHDAAFSLEIEKNTNNVIAINSKIKDHKNLPQKIIIYKNDKEYFFNTSDWNAKEVQDFLAKNGEGTYNSTSVVKDIEITVMIPNNLQLHINSEFGMLEIEGFKGQLFASSKFSGIDISVPKKSKNTFKTGIRFGDVYTNLNLNFEGKNNFHGNQIGKWELLSGNFNGGGTLQELESEFGNIYIREMK